MTWRTRALGLKDVWAVKGEMKKKSEHKRMEKGMEIEGHWRWFLEEFGKSSYEGLNIIYPFSQWTANNAFSTFKQQIVNHELDKNL